MWLVKILGIAALCASVVAVAFVMYCLVAVGSYYDRDDYMDQ